MKFLTRNLRISARLCKTRGYIGIRERFVVIKAGGLLTNRDGWAQAFRRQRQEGQRQQPGNNLEQKRGCKCSFIRIISRMGKK